MSKLLVVNYEERIDNCGECYHDYKIKCELTDTPIKEHWEGVLPNCPLEDIEE